MRKLLSIILAVVLILSIIPFSANAYSTFDTVYKDGDYSYKFVAGEAPTQVVITDFDSSVGGDIIIPKTLAGNEVVSIESSAFSNCDKITSVIIPDTVTSIYHYAFGNCTELTSVTIPDSVTYLEGGIFNGCSKLVDIDLPDVGIDISNYAFDNTALYNDSNNWENGVLYVDNHLIVAKSSVSSHYEIKDGTKSIACYAFYNRDNLTSITIPNSVSCIGSYAFGGCNNLKNVYINDIAAWCNINFRSGSSQDYYVTQYSSNPLNYGANLYLNNELVTDLVIPEGVIEISDYAFYNCNSITSVTIPQSVKKIGAEAFYECRNLKKVYITDIAAWCKIEFGLTDGPEDRYFSGPANPLYYGADLYLNNQIVTDLVIPSSVNEISANVFFNCKSIVSVTIPQCVEKIGDDAFGGCRNLKKVYITDIAAWCKIKFELSSNIDYSYMGASNPLYYDADLYLNNQLITDLVIPDGITKINDGAFYNCQSLKNVTISNSVTEIGRFAFVKSSLENVIMSENVEIIDEEAFYGCENLTSVVIPNSVKIIENDSFRNCKNLKNITLPAGPINIKWGAFYECDNLTDVYYRGTLAEKVNVVLGNTEQMNLLNWHYESCIGKADHTYTDASDNECNVCGGKRNQAGHQYTYFCDEYCDVCNQKREVEHSFLVNYMNNVENHWLVCGICGKKKDVTNHVYSNGCDNECNVCEARRKTNHNYVTVTTNATFDAKGSIVTKCTVCGVVTSSKSIPKLVPKGTKISKLTAARKSLKVKIKKEKSVSGYQIQYSLKKNFKSAKTVTLKKNSITSKTIKKLKPKKKYYVRVRTYKTYKGKKYYSAWSTAKKKKTK